MVLDWKNEGNGMKYGEIGGVKTGTERKNGQEGWGNGGEGNGIKVGQQITRIC